MPEPRRVPPSAAMRAMTPLRALLEQWERDPTLLAPDQVHRRSEALDRLDALLAPAEPLLHDESSDATDLHTRAAALRAAWDAVDADLFAAVRSEIRRGAGRERLLRWAATRSGAPLADGYDALDMAVAGVLALQEPRGELAALGADMVFYQPTPARQVFDLIERTALDERDVLIDLGAGLGHVPLLVAACTDARSIGIERETAYVACAQRSASDLKLARARFVAQDVRQADLSSGTVFYLYTPFTGAILRDVLDALHAVAARREIRVCTLGPCTPTVAREAWLRTDDGVDVDRVTLFRSTA